MATLPRYLKHLVIANWEKSGGPNWDKERTIREAESADDEYASHELNPAKEFRAHRRAGDRVYVTTWVLGCHFDWLNPRD